MESLSLFDAPAAEAPSVVLAAPPAAVPAAAFRPPRPAAPVLLAIDGNSLAHRAFHAYGRVDEALGRPRGGLYGFVALLCALSDKVAADGIVVGFDCRVSSWRKHRYAAYKANRVEKDPALYDLLDEAPTVLVELGVPVIVADGWEADDVVGSAAAQAASAGWRCVVATSDRDAFALIDDTTMVLRLRSGLDNAVEMTRTRLHRDFGILPEQYIEFAALRGDTSDNLPGISGIGPSRAAALLAAYATVAEAVADPLGCRSVLGKPLGQALIDDYISDASVFRRNVELMTIRRDVGVDIAAARLSATAQQVADCLGRWELGALSTRATLALAARPEPVPLPPQPPTP